MKLEREISDALGDPCLHQRSPDKPIIDRKKWMISANRNAVPSRIRARQTNGSTSHIGPVLRELHHLRPLDEPEQFFRTLEFNRRRTDKVRAVCHFSGCALYHRLVGVPQRDGAQSHTILDEFVPVHIPHMATFPPDKIRGCKFRELVVALRVCMASAWYHGLKPVTQL